MQIVARASLLAFLTGPSIDPDGLMSVEMSACAKAVDQAAPAEVSQFIFLDLEGGDPMFDLEGYNKLEIIDMSHVTDNGYYGLDQYTNQFSGVSNIIFNCYLGGSPLQSATGFMLATVAAQAE